MKNLLIKLAEEECVSIDQLKDRITRGTVAIPLNKKRLNIEKPCAIGEGLSVKVNANIGASPDKSSAGDELKKLEIAVEHGADTVMDLTIGKNWKKILAGVLEKSPIPVGTVPAYGAVCLGGDLEALGSDDFVDIVRQQAEMGVDFMTVHSGVCKEVVKVLEDADRLGGMVSRGGKIIYRWMKRTGKENPFYERFDELLDIAFEHNVTLSLGDGLRPGALADASDDPQYAELKVLGELAARCRDRGVQVIIEGPGHVPLHLIEENVKMAKELCGGAPFYVLGPLTIDIGAGYDHIAGAIGGALAAWKGADFLCYLTPAEHLYLPEESDVAVGVITSKIAAHSADIARNPELFRKRDDKMSRARADLDWDLMQKYALDPNIIKRAREKYPVGDDRACSMCGEYCALLD
ncbi:MAG: phosphomethylpyrimidine synthase ThiC [Elusimicrobia bacterium]|nr:phosphomethylpyrimidine synthase ThiC [Elusimicrobiota bacterium]